jgi:hypothetical protein
VFFGKRTVNRFSIFSKSERVAYDEKVHGSVCRINVLDKILATGGYFNPFCSCESEKKKRHVSGDTGQ